MIYPLITALKTVRQSGGELPVGRCLADPFSNSAIKRKVGPGRLPNQAEETGDIDVQFFMAAPVDFSDQSRFQSDRKLSDYPPDEKRVGFCLVDAAPEIDME